MSRSPEASNRNGVFNLFIEPLSQFLIFLFKPVAVGNCLLESL